MSIIAPRPDQNAYIEQFNRSYRTEVVNAHLFESIAELPALSLLGTRRMVETLTRDRAGMRQTVALFTAMRAPVPESVRPACRPAAPEALSVQRASVSCRPSQCNRPA